MLTSVFLKTDGSAAESSEATEQPAEEEKSSEFKTKANETTKEGKEKAKKYLLEKFPEERRNLFVERFKKVIVEVQGNDEYYQAIDTLLYLIDRTYTETKSKAREKTKDAQGVARDIGGNDNVKVALTNLRTLIERFANGTSMNDLFESLTNIYDDAGKDAMLSGWFKQVNVYLRKCLKEQGFVTREDAKTEWHDLYEKGRFLLRERYRGHVNRIFDEVKFLADQFNQDVQNKAFAESVKKLFTDIGLSDNDALKIAKNFGKDILEVISPEILSKIRYIPIPRIEVTDPMIDMVRYTSFFTCLLTVMLMEILR